MPANRHIRAERYLAVISHAHAPAAYAGMDGLVLIIARTEREFAQRQRGPIKDLSSDFWAKASLRKICARSSAGEAPPDQSYEFIGHDVGHLNMWGSVYSLIVNYLLNNRPSHATGFNLNDHQLLRTREEATKLLAEWNAWSPAGEGDKEEFDDGDVMQPYAVFKARDWPGLRWQ